jgi:hypothetical protein
MPLSHDDTPSKIFWKQYTSRETQGNMRWAGHIACMWKKRNEYRTLVGKSDENRPLVRPRHRWKVNIKMDLREGMRWYGLDLSGSG